jgi:hypothetical protein
VFRLVGADCDPLAGCERFDGKHVISPVWILPFFVDQTAPIGCQFASSPPGMKLMVKLGFCVGFLPCGIVVFPFFWRAPLPAVPAVRRVIGSDARQAEPGHRIRRRRAGKWLPPPLLGPFSIARPGTL